ncbi:MAG: hypothetical protein LBT88_08570 [Oscillospiraceae bacterium]|jgi:hypothetical protein|nr:hypothetical protein [Oscillospiraceae bacterium]
MEQLTATYVGVWPLTISHDPALDELGLPNGAAIFGLFDESYTKYAAPEKITDLTAAASLAELRQGAYCAVHASSGFGYIIAMTDNPENLTVEMLAIPSSIKAVKCYKQTLPATRFIGKKYGDEDRVNGYFSSKWSEWHENNWFSAIENAPNFRSDYFEDSDAYIGLMRFKDDEPFQYWIGMFCSADTAVPDGFSSIDLPQEHIGVCWLYGPEADIYGQDDLVLKSLKDAGLEIKPDADGAWWFFERYACPRMTAPDADANVILDHCYFINE